MTIWTAQKTNKDPNLCCCNILTMLILLWLGIWVDNKSGVYKLLYTKSDNVKAYQTCHIHCQKRILVQDHRRDIRLKSHKPKQTISCGQWARVITDGIRVEEGSIFWWGSMLRSVTNSVRFGQNFWIISVHSLYQNK